MNWFPAASLMTSLLDSSILCSVCCQKPSFHFMLQELLWACDAWVEARAVRRRTGGWASEQVSCLSDRCRTKGMNQKPMNKGRDGSMFCAPGENAGGFKGDEQWLKLTSTLERAPLLPSGLWLLGPVSVRKPKIKVWIIEVSDDGSQSWGYAGTWGEVTRCAVSVGGLANRNCQWSGKES